ncbi:MAG: hypothetical protein K0S45_4171, partial [Nitrospira sp.]|nr:hypothetical protein [Nitrospira sp.]
MRSAARDHGISKLLDRPPMNPVENSASSPSVNGRSYGDTLAGSGQGTIFRNARNVGEFRIGSLKMARPP